MILTILKMISIITRYLELEDTYMYPVSSLNSSLISPFKFDNTLALTSGKFCSILRGRLAL